jgi:hypothetical protein
MCKAPANNKKLSIILINTCSKLIFDTNTEASDEIEGTKYPEIAINTEQSSAITITPMVGGHLIQRSLM